MSEGTVKLPTIGLVLENKVFVTNVVLAGRGGSVPRVKLLTFKAPSMVAFVTITGVTELPKSTFKTPPFPWLKVVATNRAVGSTVVVDVLL